MCGWYKDYKKNSYLGNCSSNLGQKKAHSKWMSKLQHETGLRYKNNNKQKQWYIRELTRAERCGNHYVLETEYIINARPVFYCIDTVTICSRNEVQSILKNQVYQQSLGKKKLIQNEWANYNMNWVEL